MGIFSKFKSKEKKLKDKHYKIGMEKSRNSFSNISDLFEEYNEVTDELFDEIEELLILADIGVETTVKLVDAIRSDKGIKKTKDINILKELIVDKMFDSYKHDSTVPLNYSDNNLDVYLFVGVVWAYRLIVFRLSL